MADDYGDESSNESGSGLRAKLEAALGTIKTYETELIGFKAEKVIQEKGLKHISAADLAGIPLNELDTKAPELDAAKAQQAESLFRSTLAARGLSGDQLESALAVLTGSAPEPASAVLDRIRKVGSVQAAAPASPTEQGLYGEDLIRAAVHARKN